MRVKARHFLIFLLLSAPAGAVEWRPAGAEGFSTIYYDPASRAVLPDGAIGLRALTDYDPQAPEAGPFRLSEKGLSEIENAVFDCVKGAYRSDGGRWFSGHMATGSVKADYPARAGWSRVPSFYAGLFAKACAAD